MDAQAYLLRHGWSGPGNPLNPNRRPGTHSGLGLTRPILVARRQGNHGVGKKTTKDATNQWWLRGFEDALKDVGQPNKTAGGVPGPNALTSELYRFFVRGEVVAGTLGVEEKNTEEEGSKKRKADDDEELRAKKARKNKEGESKEERRVRREEKKRRKEEKVVRREERERKRGEKALRKEEKMRMKEEKRVKKSEKKGKEKLQVAEAAYPTPPSTTGMEDTELSGRDESGSGSGSGFDVKEKKDKSKKQKKKEESTSDDGSKKSKSKRSKEKKSSD
ncbi:hypothetical protein FE257_001184 [Aspergillus nanangensis]|uniref:Protein TMA23 n=1 Tax=Aspergillus nanangensis TaxID=2582783 RepID=A0AAD4CE77_ASPNN|nr:hypothetical protein FE257_001184 [Aspergillus nanangensis]